MSTSWRTATAPAVRYLTDPRRRLAVVLISLAAVGLIAFGVFATLGGPPPQQQAVVYFDPAATVVEKDAARAACPSVGQAVQLPPDRNDLAINRAYPLRYDVAKASTQDRAAVYACVSRQPGVVGMSQETQGQ